MAILPTDVLIVSLSSLSIKYKNQCIFPDFEVYFGLFASNYTV